jgi:hypothetical protein
MEVRKMILLLRGLPLGGRIFVSIGLIAFTSARLPAAEWSRVPGIDESMQFLTPQAGGVYAYGSASRQIRFSGDRGAHWNTIGPALPDSLYPVAMAIVQDTVWLAGRDLGTFSWSPARKDWFRSIAGFLPGEDVVALGAARGFPLAGANDGLWSWNPGQGKWASLSEGNPVLQGVPIYGVVAAGDLVFLANNRGDSFLGKFQGTEYAWAQCPVRWPYTLIGNGGSLYATCLGLQLADGNHRIIRSVDDGASWTAMDAGLPLQEQFRGLARIGNSLFASPVAPSASAENPPPGAYRTDDEGAHWIADTTGLPKGTLFASLIAIGDTLVGTSSGGLWIRPHAAPVGLRARARRPGKQEPGPASGWFPAPNRRGEGKAYRISGRCESRPRW